MTHKLTVAIPSYKQPDLLDKSLLALKYQTFKDFNVIIIDDNSDTDLSHVINKYNNDLNISIIINEINLGAMFNMLKSIKIETGSEYVFSYHEDDCIKINYLEEAVKILDKEKNVSFVISSPEWIKKSSLYTPLPTSTDKYELINDIDFSIKSLKREPFVFGSVIYRKRDVNSTFNFKDYHTLCDKIFLIDILNKNKTFCAYIKEPSIYVRDHSLDEKDNRSDGATVNHLINYFNFYKNFLSGIKNIDILLTNGLLLAYSNLQSKTSIFDLFQKQYLYKIIKINKINGVGIYSIISLFIGKRLSYKLTKLKIFKRII